MDKKVTVLTPTYNRAYCLNNAFESMQRQENKDFVWIIVDDGSIDNTTELVEQFKHEASFEIDYIKKENGGKHRALNVGIEKANTELLLILDSDDFFTNDAIKKILDYHNKVESYEGLCGYSFLRVKQNGDVIGKKFPEDYYISNHIECRFNQSISGDKAEVYFTDILKKYPFPEIEGEKFLTEAIVWSKIGREYNTIYINEPLIVCEYLPDGLTNAYDMLCMKNPKGMALFCKENCDDVYRKDIQERFTRQYIAYSLLAGEKIEDIKNNAPKEISEEDIQGGKKLYNSLHEKLVGFS